MLFYLWEDFFGSRFGFKVECIFTYIKRASKIRLKTFWNVNKDNDWIFSYFLIKIRIVKIFSALALVWSDFDHYKDILRKGPDFCKFILTRCSNLLWLYIAINTCTVEKTWLVVLMKWKFVPRKIDIFVLK